MTGLEWIFDESPIPDPHGRGQRAVDFLKLLKHPKSPLPGKAFQLDPPFERIVRRIYGPSDEHGKRQVRTVYLQVGRGSRKTSLAAALALLHTYGPERVPKGANYVAAADRAVLGDQTTSDQLILGVEVEGTVLESGFKQCHKVSGVQRTGVIGH